MGGAEKGRERRHAVPLPPFSPPPRSRSSPPPPSFLHPSSFSILARPAPASPSLNRWPHRQRTPCLRSGRRRRCLHPRVRRCRRPRRREARRLRCWPCGRRRRVRRAWSGGRRDGKKVGALYFFSLDQNPNRFSLVLFQPLFPSLLLACALFPTPPFLVSLSDGAPFVLSRAFL